MVERHRIPLLRGVFAVVSSLLAGCSGVGMLQPGLHATVAARHHDGCRDGMCDPHCPVRPGADGFYETQWRRRSSGQLARPDDGKGATPAGAPRSIVPRAEEESSRLEVRSLPPVDQPAGPPASVPAPPIPLPAPPQPQPPAEPPRTAPPEDDNLFSLRAAANDPDPWVRTGACRGWEERGGPEAVRFLTERAGTDPDLGVRLRAIRGLGELRDPRATAALMRLLDDPDPAVQHRVCLALGRSTGLALGDDPQRWRQWAAQASAASPTPRL